MFDNEQAGQFDVHLQIPDVEEMEEPYDEVFAQQKMLQSHYNH